MKKSPDSFFYEYRLVEHYRCDELFRNIEEMADHFANAVHDFNGVSVATLLHDRKID